MKTGMTFQELLSYFRKNGFPEITSNGLKGKLKSQEFKSKFDKIDGKYFLKEAPGPEAPGPEAPGPEAPGPEAPGPEAPAKSLGAETIFLLMILITLFFNASPSQNRKAKNGS